MSRNAKLDYKMDYLIVRQIEATIKIHLSEIYMLIIESTAVSLTAYLLCELCKRKIKVVFCDERRNPCSELISYYGSHDTSAKVRSQIAWSPEQKQMVWTEIVGEKIRQQACFLQETGFANESALLRTYIQEMEAGDATNREGHAAKVYFNALFGMDFTRTSEHPVNAALNYGYGILLSAFNREIVSNGYITQLGVFHDNMFNQFNLGSDLMEPFRILVDRIVFFMKPEKLEKEEKLQLVNVLNANVVIDGKSNYVSNAIRIYCKSIFDALNNADIALIRFYRNEL